MSLLKKTADQLTVGDSLKIQGIVLAAFCGVLAAPVLVASTYNKISRRFKKADNAPQA